MTKTKPVASRRRRPLAARQHRNVVVAHRLQPASGWTWQALQNRVTDPEARRGLERLEAGLIEAWQDATGRIYFRSAKAPKIREGPS